MSGVYWSITSCLLLIRTETFFDIQLNIKGKKNGMYNHILSETIVLYDGLLLCFTGLQSLNLHSIVSDTVKKAPQ